MIQVIISDFARVILFPKDGTYTGLLNALHGKLLQENSDYNFFNFFFINDELLHFYESLKPSHTLCLITESTAIQKVPAIKTRMQQVFDHIYTPIQIGTLKADPRTYLYIAEQLNKDPSEILLIDDRAANLEAAHKVGLQTLHYSSNDTLFEDLQKMGIKKR